MMDRSSSPPNTAAYLLQLQKVGRHIANDISEPNRARQAPESRNGGLGEKVQDAGVVKKGGMLERMIEHHEQRYSSRTRSVHVA